MVSLRGPAVDLSMAHISRAPASAISPNSTSILFPRAGALKSLGKGSPAPAAAVSRKFGSVRATLSNVRPTNQTSNFESGPNGSSGRPSSRVSSNFDGSTMVSLQAWLTIRKKRRPDRDEQMVDRMDVIGDLLGQNISLQLVSMDVDPATKVGKRSRISGIKDWAEKAAVVADKVQYTADFVVDKTFGVPGAVVIINRHQNEFFLETICLQGHESGPIHFPCNSWMHSFKDNPAQRVFFSNKTYLPSTTPAGLKDLREADLKSLRGDGKGRRKSWENVYDYAVYNDLGDGDEDAKLIRPVLGGSKAHPYPRRCRTGRPPARHDRSKESRLEGKVVPYVPRDEAFEAVKQESYFSTAIRGLVHQSMPKLRDHFFGSSDEFESFEEIDRLYCEGVELKKVDANEFLRMLEDTPLNGMLPDIVRAVTSAAGAEQPSVLRYPRPQLLSKDRFAWLRDDEFGRQTLAGLNPCAIQRLKVFPPMSELDPKVYGSPESAIKEEHIADRLEGLSVRQALEEARLFILDYHDVFMPYVNGINSLEKRAGYASRTIYFLTSEGTLKPLVIELCLPPPHRSQRVFVPGHSATEHWLWQLAKAHVSCNDAGFHQLVSHWLRTHAATEPYVIATNRQLSIMHPVYRLLHPHFRYTMEINAAARQSLICADGVIEKSFQPGPAAMEISSAYYAASWRFDRQGLPEDLIDRGMAVEDPSATHGLRLAIEDYPFAADGLLMWTALETWVREYVAIYYKDPESVRSDHELLSWWAEIRYSGHADKKDESWWPALESEADLTRILTIMMWIASGFHAAVNFGQFAYAGYVPNKPTHVRRLVPEPGTAEWREFQSNPQQFLLSMLPGQLQATVLMAVIESLSTHSPDEEYLGQISHPKWLGCPDGLQAFRRFQQSVSAIDREITARNNNAHLRNRNGAGILPYELLLPTSGPGITGRGVPNSISI
ncbi:lipoxygenase [Marchantia polymorpha subsp. ruderalis]